MGKLPELQLAITDLPALLRADVFQILTIATNHPLRAGDYFHACRGSLDLMLTERPELEQLVLVTALQPSLAANAWRVDQRVG